MANQRLRTVKTGDPNAPGTVNTPLLQLQRMVTDLRDRLDAAEIGAAVVASRAPLESVTVVGSPVYWDEANGRFGAAQLSLATSQGLLALASSAKVLGVVVAKNDATTGTVLLAGTYTVDVSGAVATGETYAAGYFYLAAEAGKVTRSRPFVSVPCYFATGEGKILFTREARDAVDNHSHLQFSLTCRPAGVHYSPGPGGAHTISDADDSLPGWLPAGHSSFGGNAPLGAVFGYNLSADPDLAAVWPPMPISAADLWWDKGIDADVSGTRIPLGFTGLAIIDRHGIWWTSDCYGDVPWPKDLDSTDHSQSYSDDAAPECPRHLDMSLILAMARPTYDLASAVVASLHSVDPRLQIRCRGTNTEAETGHLEIDLDLELSVATDDTRGASVLKGLSGSSFTKGNVLEGVYPLSDNVTLVSNLPTVKRVPGDDASEDVYQGLVGITVAPQSSFELAAEIIRLDGVEQDFIEDIPLLTFPEGKDTALRLRFDVAAALGLSTPKFRLRLLILGRAAGALPALTVTYRRLPRPADGLNDPENLPTSDTSLSITMAATLTNTDQYVEATSSAFTVVAGDRVYFTVSRDSGDAYAADLALVSAVGVLANS